MYDWAEFRHFRYLLAILEEQGFRAAAEILHTAQPNLSVQARQFQENAAGPALPKDKEWPNPADRSGDRLHGPGTISARYARRDHRCPDCNRARHDWPANGSGCSPVVDPGLFRTLCCIQKQLLPSSTVRPTHGDAAQLAEEVANGTVDAALVTLPLKHPDLNIEEVCQDRLVVCLRKDDALAAKARLQPADLEHNLNVLYDPHRHPDAHAKLS